jgi:hypothetical protein
MPDPRRKRSEQQAEGASNNTQKYLLWAGIVVLFALAYFAGWHYKNHKYDKFAQCLAAKNAKMYGLYWCPHCQEQKEAFGGSFHYVPYVECAIKGSSEMAPECKVAGVKLFPSWQFAGEAPKEGVLSLEALSDKTGCSLP